MENSETKTEPTITSPDLAELGELCGCTEKQIKFAEGMLQGMSQTEAAFHAGYAGARDLVQLRSAGSSTARSKPVQALLALAESRGLGVPNAPGDKDELKRILWSHARSKDKAHSIKASTELMRLEAEERAAKEPINDPYETLAEIAEIMPALAVALGSQLHHKKFELTDEQQKRYEEYRRGVALEYIAEQRARAAADGRDKSTNEEVNQ